jgi:hypothetical protein
VPVTQAPRFVNPWPAAPVAPSLPFAAQSVQLAELNVAPLVNVVVAR